ncbi:Bax inhibitor-1/YccA family protein [uncultured Clostridium sp.]|uniref:Bax inhibitor-1/YccA family protein n=1 Tax=uncultured Clostridium sp. TaxID=59620 RepID=UPI00261287CB|nr:Bax inhibitor-1/YccA family protein [uncultured Clostridium sp.]
MRKGNPVLLKGINATRDEVSDGVMTVRGAVTKSFLLMLIVAVSFVYSFSGVITNGHSALQIIGLASFIVAIITVFVPKIAKFTAIIYAALQGFLLGAVTNVFNVRYQGIATQAILMTIVVAMITLLVYRSVPTLAQKVRKTVYIGLISMLVISLLSIVFSFIGISLPFYGNGPIGIIFSLVAIVLAAMSLMTDFDNITQAANYGAPKYMEWYCAFGLTVTLIWLYTQILSLLSKLSSRD